jgi:hypothetical protein
MSDFRICATLAIKKIARTKVEGRRGQWPFVTWSQFCMHVSMANLKRNKFCHYVLDAESYRTQKLQGFKANSAKKARKTTFFALFIFLFQKQRVNHSNYCLIYRKISRSTKWPSQNSKHVRLWSSNLRSNVTRSPEMTLTCDLRFCDQQKSCRGQQGDSKFVQKNLLLPRKAEIFLIEN